MFSFSHRGEHRTLTFSSVLYKTELCQHRAPSYNTKKTSLIKDRRDRVRSVSHGDTRHCHLHSEFFVRVSLSVLKEQEEKYKAK